MPDIGPWAPQLQRGLQAVTGTVTDIILDQRRRMYNAEVQHQYSTALYQLNRGINDFMVKLQGRTDYENFGTEWDQLDKQLFSDISANVARLPEAKQQFEQRYMQMEVDNRFKVDSHARKMQIAKTIADDQNALDFYKTTRDWDGYTAQVETMKAGGIYTEDQITQVMTEGYHDITSSGYLDLGNAIVGANRTQEGIDEAVAWLANNTPEWLDEEKNSRIGTFERAWKMRIAREQDLNANAMAERYATAFDELDAWRKGESSEAFPLTIAEIRKKYDLNVQYGMKLEQAAENVQEGLDEQAADKTFQDTTARLDDLEGNNLLVQLASEANAAFEKGILDAGQRDVYLDAGQKLEGETIENKGRRVIDAFKAGLTNTLDPGQFLEEKRWPGLSTNQRQELWSQAWSALRDKEEKGKGEDPLGDSQAVINDVYANIVLNTQMGVQEKTRRIRALIGPDAGGNPQLAGKTAGVLIKDAEHFTANPQDDAAMKSVQNYYLPQITALEKLVAERPQSRDRQEELSAKQADYAADLRAMAEATRAGDDASVVWRKRQTIRNAQRSDKVVKDYLREQEVPLGRGRFKEQKNLELFYQTYVGEEGVSGVEDIILPALDVGVQPVPSNRRLIENPGTGEKAWMDREGKITPYIEERGNVR